MPRFLHVGLIGLLMATLAACGGTATQPPGGTAAPTSAATAEATLAETPTEAAGASPTLVLPSFQLPHNATELEALLPDTLGGVKLQKFSWTGPDFVNQNSQNTELNAFLQSLGKSLSDISAAAAFSSTFDNSMFAFRVTGVDHSVLISEFQKAQNTGLTTPIPWTPATVGGKSVVTSPASEGTVYVYGVSDLVFEVFAKDQATAAELLSKLP